MTNKDADTQDLLADSDADADLKASCYLAVATWLRFSAMRLLTWNRNCNIKPREVSAAQVFFFTSKENNWAVVSNKRSSFKLIAAKTFRSVCQKMYCQVLIPSRVGDVSFSNYRKSDKAIIMLGYINIHIALPCLILY